MSNPEYHLHVSVSGPRNPNWKGGMASKECIECKNIFFVYQCQKYSRKFCSNICYGNSKKGEKAPQWRGGDAIAQKRSTEKKRQKKLQQKIQLGLPITKPLKIAGLCNICNKDGLEYGRLRHKECRPKPTLFVRLCVDCGATKKVKIRKGHIPKRCAPCLFRYRNGENNPRWKGGITPINKKIRQSKEYIDWRKAVFERDNYSCVWCSKRGGILHADHIKPFSTHPDLRMELSNGRTLCVPCHKKTPTYLSGALRKEVAK